jgi:hypothetical protein
VWVPTKGHATAIKGTAGLIVSCVLRAKPRSCAVPRVGRELRDQASDVTDFHQPQPIRRRDRVSCSLPGGEARPVTRTRIG